jgi:hypothetical protein
MDGTGGMNVLFHQYRNPWYCLDPVQAGATSLAALLVLYYSSKKEYLSLPMCQKFCLIFCVQSIHYLPPQKCYGLLGAFYQWDGKAAKFLFEIYLSPEPYERGALSCVMHRLEI